MASVLRGSGDSSFGGNLSIEGVLTYEDVASVDSIGVITARSGLHVGTGASIFSPDTNELALGTNNTQRLTISSGGNVGIGISSPSYVLDIDGTTSATVLQLNSNNATYGVSSNYKYNNTSIGSIGSAKGIDSTLDLTDLGINGVGNIDFCTNYTKRLRITSAGLFGIGTTSPGAKLQVNQDASDQSGAAAIKAIGTAYGTNKAIHSYMDTSNSNKSLLYLENGSGVVMNVDGAGNVGIGTDSPIGTLHTSGNSADLVGALLENRADAGSSDSVSLNFVLRRAGGFQFGIPAIKAVKENAWTSTPSTINSSLVFSTIGNESSSERMRLNSNGELLVNTLSSGGGIARSLATIGACTIHSTGIIEIASGGTLDLPSVGTSMVGHLYVHSVYTLNAAVRTSKVFFVAGRFGNGFTATELNSNSGSSGGRSFTITNPSNNIIRFTDTSGAAVRVTMSFVGSLGF